MLRESASADVSTYAHGRGEGVLDVAADGCVKPVRYLVQPRTDRCLIPRSASFVRGQRRLPGNEQVRAATSNGGKEGVAGLSSLRRVRREGVLVAAGDDWAKVGKYFDGKGSHAVMSGPVLADRATIEGWFVWLSGGRSLLRDSSEGHGWNLGFSEHGLVACAIGGIAAVSAVEVQSLSAGWHYYVLRRDGHEGTLFIDGELVATLDSSGAAASTMPWTLMKDGLVDEFVEGFAADVAMYDKALSDDQIAAHWEAGRDRY